MRFIVDGIKCCTAETKMIKLQEISNKNFLTEILVLSKF